jgi:hypothetical protein
MQHTTRVSQDSSIQRAQAVLPLVGGGAQLQARGTLDDDGSHVAPQPALTVYGPQLTIDACRLLQGRNPSFPDVRATSCGTRTRRTTGRPAKA